MNVLRLADQMKVEERGYKITKIHEEGTSVDVSHHAADDEVIYIMSHPYLQNTPKKNWTHKLKPLIKIVLLSYRHEA